jgi:Uncharacterized conserved protein
MPETYTFKGFTPATGEFFWELAFNNERTWFNEHKPQFEELLNKPMKALARETTELLQKDFPLADLECHVSRIYRDARRLHGRGPYKENLWFSIKNRSNGYNGPSFFFEITPKDWCYGMGFYCARSDEMEAFRKSIDANPTRFQRLAEEVNAMPEMEIEGEYYKRQKADYGEIINQWYNRKWASVISNRDFGGDLFNPKLPQLLAVTFAKLMPMYEYLNTFTRTYL